MRAETVRARFLFREVAEKGHDLPLGSVTKDGGVEFRSDLNVSVWNPGDDVSGYKRVGKDDFVIGLRSFQSGIGYSAIEALVSPAYTVLRPVSKQIHPPFFRYLFKSSAYISRLENVAQGIRQGRTISSEDFYNIAVRVPPLSEQKAIADYLDRETARIDALIEKKKRMINLLDHRWSNKLREVVEVQPKVEVMQLRRCVEKIVSGNWGGEPGTADVDAICVRAGDFDFRTHSANSGVMRAYLLEDIKKSCLREGDLIIEKSGGGEESPVGRVVEWKSNEVAIPTNFAAGVRANKRVSRKYLLYVFASCYSSRLTTRSIKQTTGIQNLDMGRYLSEKVPVPSLATQEVIVERLDKVFFSIRAIQNCLEKQIEVLRERRQALITAAVTGKLERTEVAA